MSLIEKIVLILFNLFLGLIHSNLARRVNDTRCIFGESNFELITGYVYSSPPHTLATFPGILKITECLSKCESNQSCESLNYETGLCILFNSSAAQNPTAFNISKFPVFTIYAQKICLNFSIQNCNRSWLFETVPKHSLKNFIDKSVKASSKVDCIQKCLLETKFRCRSANFNFATRQCSLSKMDRHTIATLYKPKRYFEHSFLEDYLENNCIKDAKMFCDFKIIRGKILKTVDAVYQNVKSVEECRHICLTDKLPCYSFDLGDPFNQVCRTSHLETASLTHINEAYFEIQNAYTYELTSCYNITVLCHSKEMTTIINTNRLFDGKVYAKSMPTFCLTDVTSSLDFKLSMFYDDLKCNVKKYNSSRYSNDIILQHHDYVVTNRDLSLSLQCTYDLSNKILVNTLFVEEHGEVINGKEERYIHNAVVHAPNVIILILNKEGVRVKTAKVGDLLTIRFVIIDTFSPYEIFIHSLIAMDGLDRSDIMLIDQNGCPTDVTILGPITKVKGQSKVLEATFEAFKFPTSEMVLFKAVVSPCLSKCQPIQCIVNDFNEEKTKMFSFGRKRRRRRSNKDDLVLTQTIMIKDFFDFEKIESEKAFKSDSHSDLTKNGFMVPDFFNGHSLTAIFILLLTAQLSILSLWICLKKQDQKFQSESKLWLYSYPKFESISSHYYVVPSKIKQYL